MHFQSFEVKIYKLFKSENILCIVFYFVIPEFYFLNKVILILLFKKHQVFSNKIIAQIKISLVV